MLLPRIAFVLLVFGLYGAFSINRLFPQAGNPALMVSLCCLALAMILGLFSWRHALGRWTTILTLICIGVPVAKSLIAWPWGQAVAAKMNAKQDASGSILDKREPRPKVTPPPLPTSDLPPRVQSPSEPAISVFDVFHAMNAAANAANAEEFRSHMAKSGHASGALTLPMAECMELFAGRSGKKTSSVIPDRDGIIRLDVMFEEPAGKSGKKRGFRFRAEEGHWRYVFDGFVEHNVSSRIEVTPPAPNVEELLNKGVFGPCNVVPVPGTDSQFDIVATCLNMDEAIAWANHFARHAEEDLKVRGLDVFVRVIKPAKQPDYDFSTPKNAMESLIKAAKMGDVEAFKRGVSEKLLKVTMAETSGWSEPMRDFAKLKFAYQTSMEGDRATVLMDGTTIEKSSMNLVRENGDWKLDMPAAPK